MIHIRDLTLSYGDKGVLTHFSLDIPLTGITALRGPSGCGKTSLLRCIAGLETPSSGRIRGIAPEETAFLFQENRLLPWRTALQHLTDVMTRPDPVRAARLLELVELGEDASLYPRELSGGMGRRLALARCLALGGKLLLLDEPFAGVDPHRARRILTRLEEEGTPILLVSHEERVLSQAHRIIDLEGPPLKIR